MDVTRGLLMASLLLLLLVVAGAGAGAAGSHEEGCISMTSSITSTLQDEMDMWVCRHGRDVKVTVHHSQGSCTFGINDSDMDDKWLRVKLKLKDNIALTVNGTPFPPRRGCVESVKRHTIKTVSVDNGNNPVLPACREGPAVYQISQHLGDVLVPWYEEEARVLLEPQDDTNITIQVGQQEFVVCNNGTHVAAQQDASACTAGVGTSAITLTIPKSNTVIKVTTADGKETVTAVSNGAAGVPPTVKKTSITGLVIMKQCMPECTSEQHVPGDASGPGQLVPGDSSGPAQHVPGDSSVPAQHIPGDCSCSVYVAWMVVFIVAFVGLAAAGTCWVFRARKGVLWKRVTGGQVPPTIKRGGGGQVAPLLPSVEGEPPCRGDGA